MRWANSPSLHPCPLHLTFSPSGFLFLSLCVSLSLQFPWMQFNHKVPICLPIFVLFLHGHELRPNHYLRRVSLPERTRRCNAALVSSTKLLMFSFCFPQWGQLITPSTIYTVQNKEYRKIYIYNFGVIKEKMRCTKSPLLKPLTQTNWNTKLYSVQIYFL